MRFSVLSVLEFWHLCREVGLWHKDCLDMEKPFDLRRLVLLAHRDLTSGNWHLAVHARLSSRYHVAVYAVIYKRVDNFARHWGQMQLYYIQLIVFLISVCNEVCNVMNIYHIIFIYFCFLIYLWDVIYLFNSYSVMYSLSFTFNLIFTLSTSLLTLFPFPSLSLSLSHHLCLALDFSIVIFSSLSLYFSL